MRRAAEQADTKSPAADTPLPAAADADFMAAPEAFPDEQPSAASPMVSEQAAAAPPATLRGPRLGHDAGAGSASTDAPGTGSRQPRAGGVFERMDARVREKIVVDENISGVSREQYRRLAATLHDAQNSRRLRVIMVASAVAGEGKTLTASNLALTFSESYQRRVLLIDADLRRPALHTLFRLDTVSGLSDGLASPDAKLVVRQVSERLSVLPAGRPNADPMAGLTSDRMRHLLEEARHAFDWVIVDTPPLGLLSDAHLLSSMIDGAVMVIRAKSTPHHMIKRAVDVIGRARILGIVLNGVEDSPMLSHYGYTHYNYGGPARDLRGKKSSPDAVERA